MIDVPRGQLLDKKSTILIAKPAAVQPECSGFLHAMLVVKKGGPLALRPHWGLDVLVASWRSGGFVARSQIFRVTN